MLETYYMNYKTIIRTLFELYYSFHHLSAVFFHEDFLHDHLAVFYLVYKIN